MKLQLRSDANVLIAEVTGIPNNATNQVKAVEGTSTAGETGAAFLARLLLLARIFYLREQQQLTEAAITQTIPAARQTAQTTFNTDWPE